MTAVVLFPACRLRCTVSVQVYESYVMNLKQMVKLAQGNCHTEMKKREFPKYDGSTQ